MENTQLTPQPSSIENIINDSKADKIKQLQEQIKELQNPANILGDLEIDTIDNVDLYESLSDFNMILRHKLSHTLEEVFGTYIKGEGMYKSEAFEIYADLNRFISKMYLHDDLISRNWNEKIQLRNDLEEIGDARLRALTVVPD